MYDFLEDAWFEDLEKWEGFPNVDLGFGQRTASVLQDYFTSLGKPLKEPTFRQYVQEYRTMREIRSKDGTRYFSIEKSTQHREALQNKHDKVCKHGQIEEEARLRGILRRHNLSVGGEASMLVPLETMATLIRRAGL